MAVSRRKTERRSTSRGPVAWVQVTGPDRRALEKFYVQLFGKTSIGAPGAGPIVIAEDPDSSAPRARHPAVFVTVPDVERALEAAERAGGEVVLRVVELPARGGRVAAVRDPAGNEVGLWTPPATGPTRSRVSGSRVSERRPSRKR